MKKHRLSNKEFWECLSEAGGLYARCARIINEKYCMSFTRQAVRERAEKDPDQLMQIVETTLDVAEEKYLQLFESTNERIKLKALQFYLRTKGKDRGYTLRDEVTGPDGNPIQLSKDFDFSNLTDEDLAAIGALLEKSKN
jgi:hypothetical protein